MGDRRVSEHPLEVGLGDRHEIADDDRQHRKDDEHPAPAFVQAAQALDDDPHQHGEGADLGGRPDEQRHRRGGAVIDIRDPHVKRNRPELERDADQDKGQGEQDVDVETVQRGDRPGNLAEIDRPRDSVEDRSPEQKTAGCDGAEDEVLHRRFCSHRVVARESYHRVQRERQQLQPKIETEHAVRRDHHHDPEGREQSQDVVFAAEKVPVLQIVPGIKKYDGHDPIGEQLEQPRQRVRNERVGESQQRLLRHP